MTATTIIRNDNLTASATTTNILAGTIFEFTTAGLTQINIYQVSSASGVKTQVACDSDIVMDFQEIPNIGTTLDNSAHMVTSFQARGGSRIVIRLQETAAVATTDVITKVEYIDLA